jgi:hypothetical protein
VVVELTPGELEGCERGGGVLRRVAVGLGHE